jgi:hypothetical protein
MDQIAVDAHVAEARLDGNRLVGHDPWGVAGRPVHLHGKAHGGIDRADAARLELGDDGGTDLVDLVAGAMEFEIGNRPRRAANRLSRHAHDVAETRLGPGVVEKDLVALWIEAGARNLDHAGVVGTAIHGELLELRAGQW